MSSPAANSVVQGGKSRRIAIVGAGWAGLSAALTLRQAGRDVTVFEAARIVGGRARRVQDPALGAIDNGQHLMLGAYSDTLALVRALNPGADFDKLLLRQPLHVESLSGALRLQAARLPAPLHTLAGLLGARGLPLRDRFAALRMMASLRASAWVAPANTPTVATLLDQHRQSATLRHRLWNPLCLAAMNTPPVLASAQVFLNVLRDSMGAGARAGDFVLARTDLSSLWPDAAARQVRVETGSLVSGVIPEDDRVLVDTNPFDACVLAVPAYAALRLLENARNVPGLAVWRQALGSFAYRSIATVTLRLDRRWQLPNPIMMLDADPTRGDHGQWIIDRTATLLSAPEPAEISVVISDAGHDLPERHEDLAAQVAAQVRRQAARRATLAPMPEVVARRVIVEKRATFDCTPQQVRPPNGTPLERVWVAGDWTDTGYPAVLEGAVRSGRAAARALLASGF